MNGAASRWTVAKRSIGAPAVRAQVQVELIDGLKVGDLEEERPAVGQDVGRADRQRVVAGLAGVPGRELGRAVARAVAVVPRLGEMAVRPARRSRGRAAARTSASTPFSWAWKAIGSWTGSPV